MDFFSKKIIIFLYAVLLLCSHNVMASDDDYMKMLEGEAAITSVDSSGKRERDSIIINTAAANIVKKKWVGECDYIDDTVPENLIRGEFASYLKQCATGTYVFYRRLELKSKNLIYENYKKLALVKLFELRENILNGFR